MAIAPSAAAAAAVPSACCCLGGFAGCGDDELPCVLEVLAQNHPVHAGTRQLHDALRGLV